jgi:cleavage and polyadenylation specificity factor subunit 1
VCFPSIFLGDKVFAEGFSSTGKSNGPSPELSSSKPASQLRRFLGMLNFYMRFLPHVAATQAPLHDVPSRPRVKGCHSINWTPDLRRVFYDFKTSLSRATLLAHTDPSAPLAFVTDSSTSATVTVLQQRDNT